MNTQSPRIRPSAPVVMLDVVLLRAATASPGLHAGPAESDTHEEYPVTGEARLANGNIYRHEYIMLTRIRDGVVLERTEYFNPLKLLDATAG